LCNQPARGVWDSNTCALRISKTPEKKMMWWWAVVALREMVVIKGCPHAFGHTFVTRIKPNHRYCSDQFLLQMCLYDGIHVGTRGVRWSLLQSDFDYRVGAPLPAWTERNRAIAKRTLLRRQTYGADSMVDTVAYSASVDKFLSFWNGDWTKNWRPAHYCQG
jgi:hypothetical protein